jgi:hypothetical protein
VAAEGGGGGRDGPATAFSPNPVLDRGVADAPVVGDGAGGDDLGGGVERGPGAAGEGGGKVAVDILPYWGRRHA